MSKEDSAYFLCVFNAYSFGACSAYNLFLQNDVGFSICSIDNTTVSGKCSRSDNLDTLALIIGTLGGGQVTLITKLNFYDNIVVMWGKFAGSVVSKCILNFNNSMLEQ